MTYEHKRRRTIQARASATWCSRKLHNQKARQKAAKKSQARQAAAKRSAERAAAEEAAAEEGEAAAAAAASRRCTWSGAEQARVRATAFIHREQGAAGKAEKMVCNGQREVKHMTISC